MDSVTHKVVCSSNVADKLPTLRKQRACVASEPCPRSRQAVSDVALAVWKNGRSTRDLVLDRCRCLRYADSTKAKDGGVYEKFGQAGVGVCGGGGVADECCWSGGIADVYQQDG